MKISTSLGKLSPKQAFRYVIKRGFTDAREYENILKQLASANPYWAKRAALEILRAPSCHLAETCALAEEIVEKREHIRVIV